MLCVTNSDLPGTLKSAYEWYDYELNFSAKMTRDGTKIKQMIGIVVRSENNNNGIFLQFSKKEFRPHLLHDGKYYLDAKKIEPLKILLKHNTWIKFHIIIKGDNIDIWIDDFKLHYRIPALSLNVQNNLLFGDRQLSELEESNNEIQKKINIWIKKYDEILKEPDSAKKETMRKELDTKEIPQNTRIIMEYPRGSIGFRESGEEKTCFRNVKLTKI